MFRAQLREEPPGVRLNPAEVSCTAQHHTTGEPLNLLSLCFPLVKQGDDIELQCLLNNQLVVTRPANSRHSIKCYLLFPWVQ